MGSGIGSYQAALAIRERLAVENAEWQSDLAVSHASIGDVLMAEGDLAGARQAYRATLAIVERLAAAHPGIAVWQHNVAVSCFKLGRCCLAAGDPSGAITHSPIPRHAPTHEGAGH